MKYSMTTDGKVANAQCISKWITGEAARRRVHEDRNRYCATMVGIGTVLRDNPFLTCRIPNGRNPIRIICDSNLAIPDSSNIVQTAKDVPTIIATCSNSNERIDELIAKNCTIIRVQPENGQINLMEMLKKIGNMGIDSIFLEGGGTLNWAAIQKGIVNKIQTYIAPKLLGGISNLTPIEGEGVKSPDFALQLSRPQITPLGDDILLESEVL